MTAEIPQVRLAWEPSTAEGEPGYENVESRERFVDETMELPIFRELESAWFRVTSSNPVVPVGSDQPTGEEAPAPVGAGSSGPVEAAAAAAPSSGAGRGRPGPKAGMTTDSASMAGVTMSTGTPWPTGSGGSAGASGPGGEVMWRTAADDGWTAAQAAMQPTDGGTTEIGLPKRVPMAQLVPGGVEPPSGGSQRRTPDSVRGLLSAYTRGVQRGRTAHGSQGDSADSSEDAGTDSSREQEA